MHSACVRRRARVSRAARSGLSATLPSTLNLSLFRNSRRNRRLDIGSQLISSILHPFIGLSTGIAIAVQVEIMTLSHSHAHSVGVSSGRATSGPSQPHEQTPSDGTGLQLVRRYPKESLVRAGEADHWVEGMCYNAARDELFFVDRRNSVVRAMQLRESRAVLRDVYTTRNGMAAVFYDVCHIGVWDAVLVCVRERGPDGKDTNWLVALSRNGHEWRETHRVRNYLSYRDALRVKTHVNGVAASRKCCAFGQSQVLVGEYHSSSLELFRLKNASRIELLHRIRVPLNYSDFATKRGSDTLVATCSTNDNSVHVHRMSGDKLEELALIRLERPSKLLWLPERLLVVEARGPNSDTVTELEVAGTHIQRSRQLLLGICRNVLSSWCAVGNGLAISARPSHELLHYSFL